MSSSRCCCAVIRPKDNCDHNRYLDLLLGGCQGGRARMAAIPVNSSPFWDFVWTYLMSFDIVIQFRTQTQGDELWAYQGSRQLRTAAQLSPRRRCYLESAG